MRWREINGSLGTMFRRPSWPENTYLVITSLEAGIQGLTLGVLNDVNGRWSQTPNESELMDNALVVDDFYCIENMNALWTNPARITLRVFGSE